MNSYIIPFFVVAAIFTVIVLTVILTNMNKKKIAEEAIVWPHERWKKSQYKDEFGHSTGDFYIVNDGEIEGSFSNTATHHDKLTLFAYFDKKHVSFRFFTYGKYIFKNAYGHNKEFEVLFLSDAGVKHSAIGVQLAYESDIYLTTDISDILTKEFRESRWIEFIVRNNTNVFKFKLYNENFNELYDEMYVPGAKLWINGRYQGKIDLKGTPSKEEVQNHFLGDPELAPLLKGKNIKKVVYLSNGYNIILAKK